MKKRVMLLIYHLADGGAERAVTLWAKMLADAKYDVTVATFYPHPNEYPLNPYVKHINLMPSYQQYIHSTYNIAACKKHLDQYLAENPQDILIPFLLFCNILATSDYNKQISVVTQTVRDSPWHNEQGFKLCMRDWAIQKQGSVILQNAEQAEYFNTPLFKHVKKYIVHNPLNPDIIHLKKDNYLPIKNIVTVGFPIELTQELASENGLTINMEVIL